MRSFYASSSTARFDSLMRRCAVTALLLLGSIACSSSRPSPLADVGEITSAHVEIHSKGGDASTTVTDPEILAELRSLAVARGDWHTTWYTPPSGQIRAALYRDTVFLGVVAIGPNFIGARGPVSERFRSIAPTEAAWVASLRALK